MEWSLFLANQWTIALGSAIIGGVVVGLVLYYGFGIGKKEKQPPIRPKLSFYPHGPYMNGAMFLEIYNSGNEDLEEITIKQRYQTFESGRRIVWEEREINRFIGEEDSYLLAKPEPLNVLRVGEKKLGSGMRNVSIGRIVHIHVRCVGARSKEVFEDERDIMTSRDEQ